jgi:hypothetical protein
MLQWSVSCADSPCRSCSCAVAAASRQHVSVSIRMVWLWIPRLLRTACLRLCLPAVVPFVLSAAICLRWLLPSARVGLARLGRACMGLARRMASLVGRGHGSVRVHRRSGLSVRSRLHVRMADLATPARAPNAGPRHRRWDGVPLGIRWTTDRRVYLAAGRVGFAWPCRHRGPLC